MNKLLDTCILIDFSRGNPQAQTFMESLEVAPCLSALTVTEILAGVRNKRERSLFDNLFGLWEIFPVSAEIATAQIWSMASSLRPHRCMDWKS